MKRKARIVLYLTGIILSLLAIQFDVFKPFWDKWAIKRVQYLAQLEKGEFRNYWLGVGVIQYPSDLITYSDLVYKLKPEVIIETGTNYGGLALYLATLLEKINPEGRVITVDISSEKWDRMIELGKIPKDLEKRIIFIKGDSVSQQVLSLVESYAMSKKALVILDSLHTREHVLKELKLYSQFVAFDSYIIVNDTHLEIMDIMNAGSGRGPLTAVKQFLKTTDEFEIDETLPGTLISCAPSGFLKRVKAARLVSDLN